MRQLMPIIIASLLCWAIGCGGSNAQYLTESRLSRGLVIILPGIEGESKFNHNIRRGLVNGGVSYAMPIHNWGRPIPIAGPLINQMDFVGNRLAAERIAKMIVSYQDNHPSQPVYMIGHSGGGGMAVFAAEALPEGRKVDGLVLLSASISSTYNLSPALRKCRNGIANFYCKGDVGLLVIGTTIAGNVDGGHGPSAGAIGFKNKKDGLYEVEIFSGPTDSHFAATGPGFVSRRVSPWILSSNWPAGARRALDIKDAKALALTTP